ncbi:LCP family protein [Streptomyces sioyaensis]|uniref:LCP family protein n=1 Tax=Streptomyces sioyaensis TaxID=67364 RepID=UPI0037A8D919
MNDWLDGSHDTHQYGGAAEPAHAVTGQIWQHAPYAPQPVAARPRNGHPGGEDPYAASAPASTGAPVVDPAFLSGGDGSYGGPPSHGGPGGPGGPVRRSTRPAATRPTRRRRILRLSGLLIVVTLLTSVGTYTWADTKLERDVDLGKLAARPSPGKGANYLIVGSDSRQGLSGKQLKDLHTGGSADAGRRTDSMILLHTGAHGTTMMSLPRDSWVTIPPYIRPETGKHYAASKDKLNAAFSRGGPELLVRTIEHNTGLHIGHYTEIGFAGFVGIVDAVGGVPMCLDKAVKDKKSGENLTKGCHTLNGRAALAFVRQRHQEAQGDLGRGQNQQKFLAALSHKTATPGVLLNPSKVYPTMNAGLGTLIVDKNMSLWNLTSLFEAMKSVSAGKGTRLHVPVSSLAFQTPKGSAVKWDVPRAKKLFAELHNDQPVTAGAKG